jgi:hypothetical protein
MKIAKSLKIPRKLKKELKKGVRVEYRKYHGFSFGILYGSTEFYPEPKREVKAFYRLRAFAKRSLKINMTRLIAAEQAGIIAKLENIDLVYESNR